MQLKKKSILVTGSGGTVGSYISPIFNNVQLYLTTRASMDITNEKSVISKFKETKPDIVLHFAAKTNVDDCELHKQETYSVNTEGTENVAKACALTDSLLVYLSTAAVFKGSKKYYTELDTPSPINEYGKSKLLGEEKIKNILEKYIILRAGWIIGGGIREKKFISYILSQIKKGEKEIYAVNDRFGSIAYAKELVEYIKFLLENNKYGLFHFGSTDVCSRYELAKKTVSFIGADTKVLPISSEKFVKQFFAPRPRYEVLKTKYKNFKFAKNWELSLKNYLFTEIKYEAKN